MKPYLLIFGIVSLISVSCINREEKELKSLMKAVFQKELDAGREVIVFEDALTDWGIQGIDSCTVEAILSLKRNFPDRFGSIEIKDVFSIEDAERICKEGRKPYRFKKEMFPEGVLVSPDRSRYDSIVEAFYRHIGEPEIVELDTELRKYMKYKTISKPVFLQGYSYAFLYIEGGGDISVYQKSNGDWKHLLMVTLILG